MSNHIHQEVELVIMIQINKITHKIIPEENCFRCLKCAWTECDLKEEDDEHLIALRGLRLHFFHFGKYEKPPS